MLATRLFIEKMELSDAIPKFNKHPELCEAMFAGEKSRHLAQL
jgi:hypothetical protein